MPAAPDPFQTYLQRASDLFESGDIVQAGQIWQAILKKKPDHEIARAGLYKVKLYFDARATQGGLVVQKPAAASSADVRATLGGPPKSQDPEIVRLLEQGCTLYDAGHVEDAITKWVQVLAKEPDNILAKGYINGARRTLGQPMEEDGGGAVPAAPPTEAKALESPAAGSPGHGEEIERLLRDGCTLFDMGQVEDALRKWEQILAREPGHDLARAYVQDARKDLGLAPLEEGARPVLGPAKAEPPATAASPGTGPEDERLEQLIRDGVQLYDMGMIQEATQKWQQALELVPGHRDAEAYLAMARRDQSAPAPAARQAASPQPFVPGLPPMNVPAFGATQPSAISVTLDPYEPEPEASAPAASSQPVTPPPSLTAGLQKPRKGFNLPDAIQQVSLPAWVASPVFILGTITGLVVLVIGSYYYMQHRKDTALRRAVASFRASATAPVAKESRIADLKATPEELRREAQAALDTDPLLAYFSAQELARLNPGDAPTAQLLERAKAGLGKGGNAPATFADFERQMKNGELEAASQSMAFLLNQTPDDRILRERAARLYALLIQAYAHKDQWSEAEAHLQRGQAMFPADRSWSAKLQLLDRIRSMPKKERASWIPLLG